MPNRISKIFGDIRGSLIIENLPDVPDLEDQEASMKEAHANFDIRFWEEAKASENDNPDIAAGA